MKRDEKFEKLLPVLFCIPVLVAMGLFLSIVAHAREADQFTRRPVKLAQLADSANAFDGWVNRELEQGVERLNQETLKRIANGFELMTPHEALGLIAESFLDPLLPELHSRVEFWATSPAGRRVLDLDRPDRRGIYSGTSIRQVHWSWFTGVSNTLKLNEVFVGIDKLGHFFAQGYQYHQEAVRLIALGHSADDIAAAVREMGHSMELGNMGFVTMAIYSPADLAANWEGWRFWGQVFGGEFPYITQDASGRWVRARSFRSADYVRSDWDEALNPPYAESSELAATIQKTIQKQCESDARRGILRPTLPEVAAAASYRVPESRLPVGATRIRFQCL